MGNSSRPYRPVCLAEPVSPKAGELSRWRPAWANQPQRPERVHFTRLTVGLIGTGAVYADARRPEKRGELVPMLLDKRATGQA